VTGAVLVVDDDPLMVRTLCDVLRRRGYQAQGAYSGEEAVAVAETSRPRAVVMDIKMAGMSGVEAFRELRARQPGLRVILMTAYSAPDILAEAARAGVDHVLPKPLELPVLLEKLGAPGGA
jgi:CheY-like chemotaxis protein